MPPKNEVLAVNRTLSARGESVDELAMWNGELWARLNPDLTIDGATFSLYDVKLWRKLET